MTLVKLTIREEPVDVDDGELAALQGQGLVERVLADPESPAQPAADAAAAEPVVPEDLEKES